MCPGRGLVGAAGAKAPFEAERGLGVWIGCRRDHARSLECCLELRSACQGLLSGEHLSLRTGSFGRAYRVWATRLWNSRAPRGEARWGEPSVDS